MGRAIARPFSFFIRIQFDVAIKIGGIVMVMKKFYVTFFDNNRSYHSQIVCTNTKEDAKRYIKLNYPEAKLIAVHDKFPAIY